MEEYREMVSRGNPGEMRERIERMLRKIGIEGSGVMCRGVVIRYLMDINQ